MLSILIAGCLKDPARVKYMDQTIASLRADFPEADYLIGLDNTNDSVAAATADRYPFARVKSHTQGLGHSWNWGLQEARHDMILQTEEDWMTEGAWSGRPSDLKEKVKTAMDVCGQDPGTFFRFDNMIQPHNDGRILSAGLCPNTGKPLYTLAKPPLADWYKGFNMYFYSNRPQIKSKRFHDLVGLYPERVTVPNVEVLMCKAVLFAQNTKVIFWDHNTFIHIGDVSVRQQS